MATGTTPAKRVHAGHDQEALARALYPFEAALLGLVRILPVLPSSLSQATWDAVLQLAQRETMAPLVHAAVEGAAVDRAPASLRVAVAQAYEQAAAATPGAYAQLAEILEVFWAARVTAMVLKGAAMARFFYADPAVRPFTDLDLLVPFEQIDRAHDVLLRAGYAIHGGAPTAADRRWRHARGYYDPQGHRLPVDLHWRYAGYPLLAPIDYKAILARARAAEIGGAPLLVPSAEDLLVALGVHFQRDLWYGKPRLRYLRDVTEISQRVHVDWPRVIQAARASPAVRAPVYVTLAAASALLGAAIPQPVMEALRLSGRGWMARRLLARVCRTALRQETVVSALAEVAWMRWLDSGSMAEYLRWLGGLVFVPRELAPSHRRRLRGIWRSSPPDG